MRLREKKEKPLFVLSCFCCKEKLSLISRIFENILCIDWAEDATVK